MPNKKHVAEHSHITRGSVFDDLGLSPTEALEAKVKADLLRDLLMHIQRQHIPAADLVQRLKVHQPDVSNLLRGKLSKFSTTKLIHFAVRLDLDVQIKITAPKKRSNVTRVSVRKTTKDAAAPVAA